MVDLIKGEDFNSLTDKEETFSLIIAILQCMMNTTNYFGDVGQVSVVGNTVFLAFLMERCTRYIIMW